MATRTLHSPTPRRRDGGRFEHAKAKIAGITGVLVVLPALVNAVYDIYAALAKLPKTDVERTNVELTRKYFGKLPVAAIPIPIKQYNGTVEVRFSIFDEGDVYVEYGRMTQWFRFPDASTALAAAPSFGIALAHAQAAAPQLSGSGAYSQHDSMRGRLLVRQRAYANGVTEQLVVEPRSGAIVDKTVVQQASPAASGAATVTPRLPDLRPIDLDALRRARAAAAPR